MTKKELKIKLIGIRNGNLITPVLEEIWGMLEERDKEWEARLKDTIFKFLKKEVNDLEIREILK